MKYFIYTKNIFKILSPRANFFLFIYLLSLLFLTILEALGLGILSLYIGILSDDKLILKLPNFINTYFINLTKEKMIYQISFFVVFLFLFKNLIILLTSWFSLKLKQLILTTNSRHMFEQLINLDYLKFYELNNSKITYKVYNEVKRVGNFIFGYIHTFKELILIIVLFGSLLYVNTKISLIAILICIFILFTLIFLLKDKLKLIARRINKHSSLMLLSIGEIVNNYILIKLSNKFNFFLKNYLNQLNLQVRNGNIKKIIQSLPRIVLEVAAVTIIVISCLIIFNLNLNFNDFIPILTFVVLVTARTIPAFTNLGNNVNEILFNEDSFNNFIQNNFEFESKTGNNKIFHQKINYQTSKLEVKLSNLSFKYKKEDEYILRDINAKFVESNLIGLTGKSGSGKSTIVKLIMGFLNPSMGDICINNKILTPKNKDWQSQIGYMPQRILLINSFLKNNIAMGVSDKDINENKVSSILNNTFFEEIIDYEKLIKNKIQEDGSNLSGGQIQLIGLARAIYNDHKVLILDEPTNNLDFETKNKFIQYFNTIKKNKLIIIISHDRDLLNKCDNSYILKKKTLEEFKIKNN
tara:strand:+ start:132 stop:1877 length:1746 start_codon:yes stop_codon:yes gene_type:complete